VPSIDVVYRNGPDIPVNWIACTRMYDVTPEVREHWHALLTIAARDAAVRIDCIDHAAPASLTDLWARDDLALAFICGFPLATHYPGVRPLAAPVTAAADGESPAYRSVWLVRANSAFDTLAATFGHRIGWTVEHSHSGFNAPRHALLAHRTPKRPRLFRESVGPLHHPRGALEALGDDRIDVTAVDSYWWTLLQRHDAATASRFRSVGVTGDAPMPPLACAAGFPEASAQRLVAALAALHEDSGAQYHLDALGVIRFVPVARAAYAPLADLGESRVRDDFFRQR
jgi:ABC-type phosphate/phosphonate transport system substrate-binding protein